MAKSTLRMTLEAGAVVALAVIAWRVWTRTEDPLPPTPEPPATEGAREDRISAVLAQKRAEQAAQAAEAAKAHPAASFNVEPTRPTAALAPPTAAEGTVEGMLVDGNGKALSLEALVVSEDGGFSFTAAEGRFQGRARAGDWHAVVQYRDGGQVQRAGPFPVRVEAGRTMALLLPLPVSKPKTAGPGFTWVHRGDFLEVAAVEAVSTAAQAGLQPGDAISEVGGVPVARLDETSLSATLFGPAGSPYRIKVVTQDAQGFRETVVDLVR